MPSLTTPGEGIDFQEIGEGPAIVFLPGSYATPAAWRGIHRLLPPRFRLISTSLCGYGATRDSRSLDDCGMEHELRVVEAVVKAAGGPVHLVGHSFGGAIALATALSGRVALRSIATFEANPLPLISARGRQDLFQLTLAMSQAFEAAHRDGERDAAARIIDFWGGEGAFAELPEAVQDYCRRTTWANVLDWRTAFQFKVTADDFARLSVPVLLVRGGAANPAMVEITETLRSVIPGARHAIVEGASHFLISTHAAACATLLSEFLESAEHR